MRQFLDVIDVRWPWPLTFWNENWHSTYSCPGERYTNFDFPRFFVFELRAHTERCTDVTSIILPISIFSILESKSKSFQDFAQLYVLLLRLCVNVYTLNHFLIDELYADCRLTSRDLPTWWCTNRPTPHTYKNLLLWLFYFKHSC